MQNNKKTQLIFSIFLPLFVLAFLVFPGSISAESTAVNNGTVRICSVLASTAGPLSFAGTTTPEGTFSLTLSTTKNFSSPVLTHDSNAKAFVHNNTTIGGVPMYCTDAVSVPFGQYYYNNISVIGNEAPWEQSKYFDGIEAFSLDLAVPYNNALFTEDTSDDITINNVADGVVIVDETRPHRTVIVLNTYVNVFDDTYNTSSSINPFCENDESMTYSEFVAARTLGKVTYALDTSTTTRKATVVLENTTGCTIPMSLSSYKMFDGIHLSTQEYFSGTPETQATSSTIFTIPLPSCLAQVDFWYGTAPRTLLDNYNYGDLPLPVVLTWALPGITGVDANGGILGPYCTHATNTPPTVTLIGANPAILTVGQSWVEPGATASDLEDGNITNNIIITGTVATTTPGTYTLTYVVTDSGGLSSSIIRTVLVLPVASCVADVNMISNGGFESQKLTIPWGSVHLSTPELSWTSYDTVVYPYVEFQAGYTEGVTQWIPHSGVQYAEIDGGTNHDVSQVLATIPGNTYTISYWASPRPNQSTAVNIMNITTNGQLLDTYIGAGSVMTDWSKRSYAFTATSSVTRLSFTQGQNTAIGEGVFLDDVSVTCNPPIIPPPPPVNACTIVSDTSTMVGAVPAVATYNQDPRWTAVIPGATWIWSTYKVVDPIATTTVVFSKTFTATSTMSHALLTIASDNSYIVKVNGNTVASNLSEINYVSTTTHNIAPAIIPGTNTITFEVTNFAQINATAESNPAGLIYKLELSGNGCGPVVTNTPPTVTLIGANPAILTVGQSWVEPGATASDLEDGNITNNIIITGTVATTTPGTYTLTYVVTDSGGLSASTTRQVIVENGGGGGPTTGSITFCSIFANKDNVITTSSVGLPFGSFAIKLATTTDTAHSTIESKIWTANSFAPNRKIILSQNDADCVTYSNLPFGSYYYSELGVTGSQWIISSTSPKYNDQFNAPVNNIFDLFSYSPELFTATTTDDSSRNVNADGQITLSADRREHTLVMVTKYADAPACMLPEFTSLTAVSGEVDKVFSFTLSATSTTGTISYSLATTSLPAGLSFSGNTISGTPTASGTFSVVVSAINPCGTTTEIVVITIAPKQDVCTTCGGGTPPPACTSNCGGGGGNGPIVTSLAITNEKVVEITPGVALVTWNTNLPATKEVGYGNASQPASFITAPFGYATSTVRVSSPLELTHSYTIAIESGKTYYFRPVSTDGKTTVAGIELVLNPGTGIGGGNENSCYYLFDYLKKGWNNNPVEVKKLQVFLRDLEGFNVEVTGIYDDQTIVALNAFQNRYKDDILTPWGHTASTSFTYITTKKKVNEIYCKMAFPVTAQQQVEIDAFRAFLLGLSQVGVTIGTPTEEQLNQPVIINTNEVGTLPVNNNIVSTSTLGTLAGTEVKSTTTPAGRLTANVLEAGKKLGNFAVATFTWPWDWAQGWFGGNDDLECSNQSVFSNWFNWILIIIIITMTYLWYRERQANKKALEVNEELDLLNK